MSQNSILRRLFIAGVLLLLAIGCEDETIRRSREVRANAEITIARLEEEAAVAQRSLLMFDLSDAAQQEMRRVKDKDPRIASHHRAFLQGVDQAAKIFSDKAFYEISTTDLPASRCTSEVLEKGFKAAGFGADDQALAMSFKEPLLAAAKLIRDKRDQEYKQEKERQEGRAAWK